MWLKIFPTILSFLLGNKGATTNKQGRKQTYKFKIMVPPILLLPHGSDIAISFLSIHVKYQKQKFILMFQCEIRYHLFNIF